MKRYLIFMFKPYEKSGGGADLVGDADTKEEIVKLITKNKDFDFGNMIDTKENKLFWIWGTDDERINDLLKEIQD